MAGEPLYAWDSRDHRVPHRLRQAATANGVLPAGRREWRTLGRTQRLWRSQPNPEAKNQRGKMVQNFDQAGVVTTDEYDFKGNLLSSSQRLANEYKNALDWSASPELQPEIFTASTTYDALNRPLSLTTPDQSVYRPTFNEANLLEKVNASLRGAPTVTAFVANIDYDARGQRVLIDYGNNVRTEYAYDPLTFRLVHLKTTRSTDLALLQDLDYTYDPGREHHPDRGRCATDDLLQQPAGDARKRLCL